MKAKPFRKLKLDKVINDPEDIANNMNNFFSVGFYETYYECVLKPHALKVPMIELTVSEEGILSLLHKVVLKKFTVPDLIASF